MKARPKIGRKGLVRAGALLAVAVIAAILLLPLTDTQPAQLSAYSGGWNDLSDFRDMVKDRRLPCRTLLTGPMELSGVDGTGRMLVIIGVEKAYTADERARINAFLRSGGSMLLADDFGHGGALVSAITGGEAGIEAKRLRDPAYIKNPDFPVVRSKSGGFVGQPSRQLVLNKPAALEGFPLVSNPYHWEVLVNASSRAWLDANQNLVRDPGEREYPYPVAVHITIGGSGGIVIASDPGMFVNDMMRWNAEYIGWLLDRMMTYPTRVTEVIFDESRHNPESAEAKVGLGLLRLANGYSASAAALVVTFIFGMLAFGYQYHSLPDWRPRRHRDALDRPCLLHFAAPYLTINEFRRLRVAIVERVRLAYGYSPDEFYPAMLPCLAGLMCDAELQAFLETETFPDTVAFQRALQRALAWRPPQADDAAQPPGTADVPYSDVELVDEGACYSQYDFRPASQPGRQSDSLYDPESDRQHDRFPVDSVLYGQYPDTPITNRESPDSPTAGGEAR